MLYSFKIDLEILVVSEKDAENELDDVLLVENTDCCLWGMALLFLSGKEAQRFWEKSRTGKKTSVKRFLEWMSHTSENAKGKEGMLHAQKESK